MLRIDVRIKDGTGDGHAPLVEGCDSLPTAQCSILQAFVSERKDDDDGDEVKKSL